MIYSKMGGAYALRLDPGEEITVCLLELSENENIAAATVSGIGACGEAEVGVFNLETGVYDRAFLSGNHEIVSLNGNLSRMNGKAYQHLHIALAGKDGVCRGGHLLRAVISLTAEIFVRPIEGEIGRVRSESLGINQMQL